jgi:hypothetical protein
MTKRPPKPPDRPAAPRFKGKKNPSAPRPPALRDLIRREPTTEEWRIAWDEVKADPPRAAAIVATAHVQSSVIFALRRRFWEEPPFDINKYLEPPGPLSSFYGCIELGFALGAYGPVFQNDLHIIRRIRNGFAHAMVPLTFDTPEIAGEIDQLQYLALIKSKPASPFTEDQTPSLADFIQHGMASTDTNREKFTVTCELLWDLIFRWGSDSRTSAVKPQLP